MKKLNIIKKQSEIDRVIKNGKMYKNRYYFLYNIYNKENKYYRFCICVSKKLGNAVTRNKNKRQIKDIIDKSNLRFSRENDYVIILRKEINNLSFEDKKKFLLEILCKLEGENNEKKY
ncbi:MAG: ribonuclease P protein component [Bacilli bacterium]|nr:ribonuclease P protein component [Bacilli bacterium]